MCVAFPMELVAIDRGTKERGGAAARGTVRSGGLELEVGLDLLDEVVVGDYVIVHAGYAIQRLTAEEARESLAILEKLQLLSGGAR